VRIYVRNSTGKVILWGKMTEGNKGEFAKRIAANTKLGKTEKSKKIR